MTDQQKQAKEKKLEDTIDFQRVQHLVVDEMPRQMKPGLENLNDGVIAIIMTIILLEIPMPKAGYGGYFYFIRNIAVFLVSFFIVAEFWYENRQFLMLVQKASKKIVVLNFLFLATLSMIPILTKWLMQTPNRLAAVTYGVVQLLVQLFNYWIFYSGQQQTFRDQQSYRLFFDRIIVLRLISTLGVNLLLIILAILSPNFSIVAYIASPIISLLYPENLKRRRELRRGKKHLTKSK